MAPPKPDPNVRSGNDLLQRCLLPAKQRRLTDERPASRNEPRWHAVRQCQTVGQGGYDPEQQRDERCPAPWARQDRHAALQKGNGSERAAEHVFTCPSHNDDPSRFVFFFTMYQIQQTGEPCSNRLARPM